METVVGVFPSRRRAEQAMQQLREAGLSQVTLLTPDESPKQVESEVSTEDMESGGIERALGGVLGGAVGMAGGSQLGVAAAILIPGVGSVLAVGLIGAAVLGAGGIVAGIAGGRALEAALGNGVPKDDLFVYEDALRDGRSVVAVRAGDEEAEVARTKMKGAGAESLDAARDRWWMGLRPVEKERYIEEGHDFELDEEYYRRGFQAAQHGHLRGKAYEEALAQLQDLFPEACNEFAFRRGYERGLDHDRERRKPHTLRGVRSS